MGSVIAAGEPVPDEREAIEELAWAVSAELYRWMTEDAAGLPPFDDDCRRPNIRSFWVGLKQDDLFWL